jgi:uncharacterized tellurite resistance protein B-like protein
MVEHLLEPHTKGDFRQIGRHYWGRRKQGGRPLMMDSIRQFFMNNMAEAAEDDTETHAADLRLAACALLLELAYADDEFTPGERVHLEGAIQRQFGLDEEQALQLIDLAEEQRANAVDLWSFTNLIAEHYSLGQKMVLAEAMWGLVYSDGELASREDYLMRKISGLLRLEPGYLAEARKRVEELQAPEEPPTQAPD